MDSVKPVFAFVLPSNKVDVFNEHLTRSINDISELREFGQFQVLFQEPWTKRDVSEVLRKFGDAGWILKYELTKAWKKPAQFIEMLCRAADLDMDVDYYILIDDDFRWSAGTKTMKATSGERFLECIDYMDSHERCGGMDCRGFFGGHNFGRKIIPVWNWNPCRGMGNILRNMLKTGHGFNLGIDEVRGMAGVWDEPLFAFLRVELGYYYALSRNHPTYHRGKSDVPFGYDTPVDHWYSKHLVDSNARKFIRERYGDPNWELDPKYKKFPVPYKAYLDNGGPDFLTRHEVYEELCSDYGE